MTTVFDRVQTKEYLSNLCPQCGVKGLPMTSEYNTEVGLYEELFTCYHCRIKWITVFAFVEKIVLPKEGEQDE